MPPTGHADAMNPLQRLPHCHALRRAAGNPEP
ncbi:Uncharacterised protein [Bordetella pertussis]|nr:Uncharacterised protein [Bordetella pertussis]